MAAMVMPSLPAAHCATAPAISSGGQRDGIGGERGLEQRVLADADHHAFADGEPGLVFEREAARFEPAGRGADALGTAGPDEAQPPQLVVCSGSSQATSPSTATTRAMPSTMAGALKSVEFSSIAFNAQASTVDTTPSGVT